MKWTNRKIWALGILVAAVVAGAVWYRMRGADLILQFVDGRTGKPVGNMKVVLGEYHRVPVLWRLQFLPWEMRWRQSARVIECADGTFRTRRISDQTGGEGASFEVCISGRRNHSFKYAPGWLEMNKPGPTARIPVPPKGPLVVPLNP
jgi:hypothetical protein